VTGIFLSQHGRCLDLSAASSPHRCMTVELGCWLDYQRDESCPGKRRKE